MSNDPINPKHYKHLPAEAIDIIMAAIAKAPSNESAYLQGQVLKYLLRCWEKKGIEDLRKAKWYLDRMVNGFNESLGDASETPVDTGFEANEDRPPKGWRKMEIGEDIKKGDRFWKGGDWAEYDFDPAGSTYPKIEAFHYTHIREIETPTELPKRHRDPTQADLRDGPIECEYRNSKSEHWQSGLLVHILDSVHPFLCVSKAEQLSNQWRQCRIQCRIEVK
jgi:hypothetical protein